MCRWCSPSGSIVPTRETISKWPEKSRVRSAFARRIFAEVNEPTQVMTNAFCRRFSFTNSTSFSCKLSPGSSRITNTSIFTYEQKMSAAEKIKTNQMKSKCKENRFSKIEKYFLCRIERRVFFICFFLVVWFSKKQKCEVKRFLISVCGSCRSMPGRQWP